MQSQICFNQQSNSNKHNSDYGDIVPSVLQRKHGTVYSLHW